MKKIPVLATVLFAYRFVFTHILAIIRISWLPVAAYTLLDLILRLYLVRLQPQIDAGNLTAVTNALTSILFWMFLSVFFIGQAAIGLTREALGLGTGQGAFYFPFGRTEWRMFGAMLRYTVGVFALFFLAGAVTLLAFSLGGIDPRQPLEGQEPGPAGAAALLLAMSMFVYASVSALRMGFFLPPVMTAETGGGVRRAHELTRGNFWRVVAVALLVGVPVLLLFGYRAGLAAGSTGGLGLLADFFFNCVMILLVWSLWCAAAAYAYRVLVTAPGAAELPPVR